MRDAIAAGYDAIASAYTRHLFDELDGKPFDRAFLQAFVAAAPPGRLLDLGCGPGHVARWIAGLGRAVTGIDLSAAMVAEARRMNPHGDFRQGDLCALDLQPSSVAGVVAFYSLIHLQPDGLLLAAGEISRVLVPGGRVAVAFHVGDEVRHVDRLWGVETSLDFRFMQPETVAAALACAGLELLQCQTRAPYAPDVEAQTTRCYMVARRPPADAGNRPPPPGPREPRPRGGGLPA